MMIGVKTLKRLWDSLVKLLIYIQSTIKWNQSDHTIRRSIIRLSRLRVGKKMNRYRFCYRRESKTPISTSAIKITVETLVLVPIRVGGYINIHQHFSNQKKVFYLQQQHFVYQRHLSVFLFLEKDLCSSRIMTTIQAFRELRKKKHQLSLILLYKPPTFIPKEHLWGHLKTEKTKLS